MLTEHLFPYLSGPNSGTSGPCQWTGSELAWSVGLNACVVSKVLAIRLALPTSACLLSLDDLLGVKHTGLGALPYTDSGYLDLGMIRDFCHHHDLDLSVTKLSDGSQKRQATSIVIKETWLCVTCGELGTGTRRTNNNKASRTTHTGLRWCPLCALSQPACRGFVF